MEEYERNFGPIRKAGDYYALHHNTGYESQNETLTKQVGRVAYAVALAGLIMLAANPSETKSPSGIGNVVQACLNGGSIEQLVE